MSRRFPHAKEHAAELASVGGRDRLRGPSGCVHGGRTLRADSRARPNKLDLIAPPDIKAPNRAYAFWVSDGSPVRCLYGVQGEKLTITWRDPGTGQQRPAGMAGGGQFVIVHEKLRQ